MSISLKRFNLVGNDHIKSAAESGALGQTVIFDGPSGSGKRTAALYAAAALLCTGGTPPCGVCHSCVMCAAGSHPDLELFNFEGETVKIKDIRELRARTFIVPSQSAFKVFVINRADTLSPECQNALLKVLEEPTSSIFILLTENAFSLLQTVRSRCKIYTMALIPGENVSAFLADVRPESPKSLREQAASNSAGVIGRALDLLDGQKNEAAELAAGFISSLSRGELAVVEACLGASALTRNDYSCFLDEVTAILVTHCLSSPEAAPFYTAIYEYMQKQKDKLVSNASVFALSSALAAFCGAFQENNI